MQSLLERMPASGTSRAEARLYNLLLHMWRLLQDACYCSGVPLQQQHAAATAAAACSSYCSGHSELGSMVGIPGSMAAAGAAAGSTRHGSASAPHSMHNEKSRQQHAALG